MQETICAKVNDRLLQKATRLFTGTLDGRIIEILQNARRAGATAVRITNKDGIVTVEDNGSGIDDFQKLLDLGCSGWDQKLEAGEDPAGVGLFSLSPRKVTIISGGKQIVINNGGWTGEPVQVTESQDFIRGTKLIFKDEKAWSLEQVEKHAVFTGVKVIVDSKYCHSMPFCSEGAVNYPEIGCRVEVTSDISKYHHQERSYCYRGKVLVNFHGQIVELDHWPSKVQNSMHILVDLTQSTQIRLMLPARTKLVKNDAIKKLKAIIELEYYKYFQKQKTHTLCYKEYLRAKQLGIELPEARPQFRPGLIYDGYGQVTEIVKPESIELKDCYLCSVKDHVETNTHLLAAFGTFEGKPFIPVTIRESYMGYSWTKLPTITKVEVTKGNELLTHSIMSGAVTCVDRLAVTVHTSDGKVFSSDVYMAVAEPPKESQYQWCENMVFVSEEARNKLDLDNIWYCLGGFSEEGDTYDTQQYYFGEDMDKFWKELIGPYESMRSEIVSSLRRGVRDEWLRVSIKKDGSLEIFFIT